MRGRRLGLGHRLQREGDGDGEHSAIEHPRPHGEPFGRMLGFKRQGGSRGKQGNDQELVGGETQRAYGTACRQPDGSWRIQ